MGQSGFIGQDRGALVSRLSSEFRSIAERGGVQVHVISGPTGIGKTRVVQEVFSAISSSQADGYWPGAITDHSDWKHSRKRINPPNFAASDDASPSWIWWGISCGRRADGSFESALIEDASHWEEHTARISRSRLSASGAGAALDITDAVVTSIGLLGLGAVTALSGGVVPAVLGAAGVGRTAWQQRQTAASLVERLSRRSNSEGTPKAQESPADREQADLARAVAKISQRVPLVLAIDDAHWADRMLVQFISHLARIENAKVLVLCTTWPASDSEAATPWSGLDLHDLLETHELNEIDRDALFELVVAEFAAIGSTPPSRDLADKLIDRVGESPLAIRAACGVQRIRQLIQSGHFNTDSIAQLPRDLEESLNAYWREASSDVQFVLSLAALLGSRFPTVPVIGAASALGARSAANAMQASRTPLSIVRSSSEFVDLFTEPGFAAIAKRHAEELLAPEDEQVLMEAVASHAEDLADKFLQKEPVDVVAAELCLNLHVGFALSGFLPAKSAALSALSLSILYWESGRSNEALRSCNNGVVLAANDPSELLLIKTAQVNYLRRAGFFVEATKVLGELKALVESQGGDTYVEFEIEHQKCVLLLDQGHYVEAKSALHECIATFEGEISHERRQSLLILSAIAALECREPEEARSQLERITSEWANKEVEPNLRHQVENLLAAALILAGDPSEGRKVLDQLVDSSTSLNGEDHTTTLLLRLNRLATLSPHHDESSVDEARYIAQQLDERPDILNKVEARIVLHEVLHNRGELAESTAELPALVEEARTRLGADHPLSLRVTNLFGQVLLEGGDLLRADAVLRECLATTTDALGPDDRDILKPLHNLAYTVWKSEKWREAAELLDRLIAETRRLVPSEDLFMPLSLRSHSYAQMENWPAAKKAAIELVEYLSIEPVRDLAALLQAQHSLVKAHVHLGEHGRALACLEQLHHQVTDVLEPEESLVIRASHGAAVANSGDLARGTRLLADVRNDARQLLGDDHPLTRSIIEQAAAASADQSQVLPIQNRAARRAAARRRKT